MKIVTFNLRFDTPDDGPFSFSNRKEEVIRRLREEMPDVVGFQEMRDPMQEYMEENLPEYVFLGHGRTVDFGGEHCPIAYRKDKFKLRAFECFWLSDTPTVPGSKFKVQGSHPRVCNMICLYDIEAKKSIRVLNAHFDNATPEGRRDALALLLKKSDEYNAVEKMPLFIMGDFNAEPDSPEFAQMVERTDYRDMTTEFPVTYHDYFGYHNAPTEKIDYIFINDMVNPLECVIWESPEGHICLSDHYPISLTCEI